MRVGVLGLNITTQSKIGLNIGAFAQAEISDNLVVQPELAYSSMGGKISDGGIVTTNLDYISVPVLLKYKLSNLTIGLGPQLGILLSAKSKEGLESYNDKESYKTTDFSGLFNLDYSVSERVLIGARYQLGLSNILNTGIDSDIFDIGVAGKNNAFQLLIGYKF
jgi:hypothetical protein